MSSSGAATCAAAAAGQNPRMDPRAAAAPGAAGAAAPRLPRYRFVTLGVVWSASLRRWTMAASAAVALVLLLFVREGRPLS